MFSPTRVMQTVRRRSGTPGYRGTPRYRRMGEVEQRELGSLINRKESKMGPYCNFCGRRCFCHFPNETPKHILDAYGTASIIATCRAGQEFERSKIGYCYDDIMEQIRAAELPLERNTDTHKACPDDRHMYYIHFLNYEFCPYCGRRLHS